MESTTKTMTAPNVHPKSSLTYLPHLSKLPFRPRHLTVLPSPPSTPPSTTESFGFFGLRKDRDFDSGDCAAIEKQLSTFPIHDQRADLQILPSSADQPLEVVAIVGSVSGSESLVEAFGRRYRTLIHDPLNDQPELVRSQFLSDELTIEYTASHEDLKEANIFLITKSMFSMTADADDSSQTAFDLVSRYAKAGDIVILEVCPELDRSARSFLRSLHCRDVLLGVSPAQSRSISLPTAGHITEEPDSRPITTMEKWSWNRIEEIYQRVFPEVYRLPMLQLDSRSSSVHTTTSSSPILESEAVRTSSRFREHFNTSPSFVDIFNQPLPTADRRAMLTSPSPSIPENVTKVYIDSETLLTDIREDQTNDAFSDSVAESLLSGKDATVVIVETRVGIHLHSRADSKDKKRKSRMRRLMRRRL